MTSTKVTSPARERDADRDRSRERPWFIPPWRDPRGRGLCVFPGCGEACEKYQPACLRHWRNAPELLTSPIRDAWRCKDQRRWLLGCEALRLYWHAVAP